MAGNTYKQEEPKGKHQASPKGSAFSWLERRIRLYGLFDEGLPIQYLPKILFVMGLFILYIWNAHYANSIVRKTDKLKREVEELRTEVTTREYQMMYNSTQSGLVSKVAELGLEESVSPPGKIVISKEENFLTEED